MESKSISDIPLWSLLFLPFLPPRSCPAWVSALASFNDKLWPVNKQTSKQNPFLPRLPSVTVFFHNKRKLITTLFESCSILTSNLWWCEQILLPISLESAWIWPLSLASLMLCWVIHQDLSEEQLRLSDSLHPWLLCSLTTQKQRRCFTDLKNNAFLLSSVNLFSSARISWKSQPVSTDLHCTHLTL